MRRHRVEAAVLVELALELCRQLSLLLSWVTPKLLSSALVEPAGRNNQRTHLTVTPDRPALGQHFLYIHLDLVMADKVEQHRMLVIPLPGQQQVLNLIEVAMAAVEE
jgi:hypothetical protein